MKKFICLILSVLLAVAAVGCKSRRRPQVSDDYEVNLHPDANVSATLRVATTNFDGEKKIISDIGALLKKKYPNVKVKIEPFSGAISTQYASWYNAGDVPDILINNTFDMFTLSDKGILLNLDPYLNAEKKDAESDFDINDYYEAYFKMGQDKFDGAQYMIPRSADRVVCHYNKAIFEAAGVDMTKVRNGWTWDDFLEVCKTLRDWYDSNGRSDYYLIDSYFDWEANYNAIFESYGVEYFGTDGSVTLNKGDAAKNALDFMKSFVNNRYIAPPGVEQAGMTANKGCMLFHSQSSSNVSAKLQQYYPGKAVDEYYDVVTMPVREGNEKIGCGAAGYSVYSGSSNRDLAWQFLKLLLSKDGQNVMADSGNNYVPLRKDMTDYTDPTNHWGNGFEKCNMSAFTYNCGVNGDPDWNCYSTFIAQQKPKQATNISKAIESLISSYLGGTSYDTAMKACVKAISRYIQM